MPAAILALLFALQDPQAHVRDLRSDDLAVREAAAIALKRMGHDAVPHLERLAKEGDADLAARAKHLLKVIDIAAQLGPQLCADLPGVEERLATGELSAWTDAFLEATSFGENGLRKYSKQGPREWHVLAGRALDGAPDDDIRQTVCERIRRYRLRGAEDQLAQLVGSWNKSVRDDAARCLQRLPATRASGRLFDLLSSPESDVRQAAAQVLKAWHPTAESELVRELAKHVDEDIRATAYRLLADMYGASAELLRAMFEDPGSSVRALACELAGDAGRREFLPHLQAALAGSTDMIRRVIESLAKLQCREAIPQIIGLLKHRSVDVRTDAARTLARLDARDAVPPLIELTRQGAGIDRFAALQALGCLRTEDGTRRLRECLQADHRGVRLYAAQALGETGAADAFQDLEKLLNDDPGVVEAASRSMIRLDRARAARVLGARIQGSATTEKVEIQRVRYIVSVLIDARVAEAAPAFRRLLEHDDQVMRMSGVIGLRYAGAFDSVPAVLKLLDEGDDALALPITFVARDARAVAAVPALRAIVRNPDRGSLRNYAADALGHIGSSEALPDLRAFMRAEADSRAAAEALCRLGEREGADALGFILRDYPEDGLRRLVAPNAIREPGLWRKLDAAAFGVKSDTTFLDLLTRVAAAAKVTLITSDSLSLDRLVRFDQLARMAWPRTLLAALEVVADRARCEFVLERDAIRVVSCEDAVAFWLDWIERTRK